MASVVAYLLVQGISAVGSTSCEDGPTLPGCLQRLATLRPRAADLLELAAAEANGKATKGKDMPSQMHLALGEAPNVMTLTWVTRSACPQSHAVVRGTAVPATTYTYEVPDRWWQPRAMVFVHVATLTGIRSREEFSYIVGDNVTPGCGSLEPITARAPPARGELPLSAALMADVGSIEILGFATWRALDARSRPDGTLDVDLCVHAGDVSYAGMDTALPVLNVSKNDEWEPLWDVYGLAHANFTSRRVYQVGIGNHEAWYNWTAVRARYPMAQGDASPSAVALAQPPFFFSYIAGGVHWTMLSTEHDFAPHSVQHAFAEAALRSVDRTITPWSVVAFHRPMYCSDQDAYDAHRPGGAIQVALEPLLVAFNVDLVVTGHEHAYERVHPNIAGRVTAWPTSLASAGGELAYVRPSAPVHLMLGHGGAVQMDTSWVTPPPAWSAVRLSEGCDFTGGKRSCGGRSYNYTDTFGWGHAEFMNRTHVRFHTEMITGERLRDVFWIVRA